MAVSDYVEVPRPATWELFIYIYRVLYYYCFILYDIYILHICIYSSWYKHTLHHYRYARPWHSGQRAK